nr:PilT/PilU family type 4a pilus ATPase [uncultured Desulfobacter sp.]
MTHNPDTIATGRKQFERFCNQCVELGASDIHLSPLEPAVFRINGSLTRKGETPLGADLVTAMAYGIMTPAQTAELDTHFTVDLGYSTDQGFRFRVNTYFQMGQPAMTIRHLAQDLPSLEKLGLPPQLRDLAWLPSGLVLVTGATGSGKSTTLAAIIDEINRNRACHILTVEDPVEFVHKGKQSLVHHRELHSDVPGFAHAVRAAMREDPDVIMVGEMRDLETMQASITAAETGHLVFSTLHTAQAVGAVERFISYFSGSEQEVARHRISMVLRAVVAQRLIIGVDEKQRIPAIELLRITEGAANLIRNAKSRQLYSMMESGSMDGMWTMDQDLARLVKTGLITRADALRVCENPEGFDRMVMASGNLRIIQNGR